MNIMQSIKKSIYSLAGYFTKKTTVDPIIEEPVITIKLFFDNNLLDQTENLREYIVPQIICHGVSIDATTDIETIIEEFGDMHENKKISIIFDNKLKVNWLNSYPNIHDLIRLNINCSALPDDIVKTINEITHTLAANNKFRIVSLVENTSNGHVFRFLVIMDNTYFYVLKTHEKIN